MARHFRALCHFALLAAVFLNISGTANAQDVAVYSMSPATVGPTDLFAQQIASTAALGGFAFAYGTPAQQQLIVELGAPKYPALFVLECIPEGLLGIATSIELKYAGVRLGYKHECPTFTGSLKEIIVFTYSGRRDKRDLLAYHSSREQKQNSAAMCAGTIRTTISF